MTTGKTKTLKTLTISRRRWLTGEDVDSDKGLVSMLYRPQDRKMCCFGFLARACGAKVSELKGQYQPRYVPQVKWPVGVLKSYRFFPNIAVLEVSEFVWEMMMVNDSKDLTKRQREKAIRRLFKAHFDITVKFVP